MTTLGDLINSIASSLHSYTGVQEQSTHLTSEIAADDLTVAVDSTDVMNRGIVEIEDELLYVNVADQNALTIAPYGRGYHGSTAATHAENTQVTFDPVFPRSEIRRAIDQTVLGLYPQLYRVQSTELDYTPTPIGYDLPADCEKVLQVAAQVTSDGTDYWQPIYNWSYDDTAQMLNLLDWLPAGATIRVVYQSRFTAFASNSDTLTSVGLKEDWADLITYAVTSRLVRFLDPARLQLAAVENAARSQFVGSNDGGKVANQLYAMYQQRLAEERKKLLDLNPPYVHFQR